VAENCTSLAVFEKGKVIASGRVKELFGTDELIKNAGLDLPFTAKLCDLLREKGIEISCDFTVEDFVRKTLSLAHSTGAGMRSITEGGGVDA
jgi:hypothetical protein